jgi:Tol biopolymer transport system component
MKDLRTRMRIFDEVPAPSYWNEIELRASSPLEAASPARSSRPALLLVAALLLVFVIGGAALVLSGNLELPGSSASQLAYELDGDIYLADSDGGNAVLIADGTPPDGASSVCGTFFGEGPMWAPDGRHFAYRSWWGDDCLGEVHVRDAEGRLVASVPGSGWDIGWSPDSTRFATWIDLFETIGIYGIDGERRALLTQPPDCDGSGDHDPQWSPDGMSVFVMNSPCALPIDGSAPQRLASTDPRMQVGATYSFDGRRVAYVTTQGDTETFDSSLVIEDADGTVLRVVHQEALPSPWYHDLVWSPAGDHLLFDVTPVSDAGYPSAATELRRVAVDTGDVTAIAVEPGIQPIRFSPEGDRILYSTRDADFTPIGLWSMDADGSNAQLLVPGTAFGDWQPNPEATDGPPSEAPSEAPPSVEPSVAATPSDSSSRQLSVECDGLEAGSYRMPVGSFSVMATVPPGWSGRGTAEGFELRSRSCILAGGVSLTASRVSSVSSTLCEGQGTDVRTETPAAVIAALAAQAGRETTGPSDASIAGYPATMFEFSLPGGVEACNGGPLWTMPGGDEGPGMYWDDALGSFVTVYVVDVGGTALAIAVDSGVPDEPVDLTNLDAILASLRIEP